jgi:2-C-methyl-D-erythritol 4-phosphate cytidylyltransferase
MNTAIIAAAGSGSRFASDTPKQFVEIMGKPLVVHTLERFVACEAIDEIILVLPKERVEWFSHLRLKFGKPIRVVSGGPTRAESVQNGLATVDEKTDVVLVHDAARPFVSTEEIRRTIAAAKRTGAACLVAKISDSIKIVEGGKIKKNVDRETLRRALTPQAFQLRVLQQAFNSDNFDASATDEASLVERLDYYYEIVAVEGSGRNIKVTHPEDLVVAESLLSTELRNSC